MRYLIFQDYVNHLFQPLPSQLFLKVVDPLHEIYLNLPSVSLRHGATVNQATRTQLLGRLSADARLLPSNRASRIRSAAHPCKAYRADALPTELKKHVTYTLPSTFHKHIGREHFYGHGFVCVNPNSNFLKPHVYVLYPGLCSESNKIITTFDQ